ncbi:MAG: toxic anion resistance protein [Deferribacteraceae bacterium]|jgi:uncharacterized protein YaaN involved in tellurite resistance|nr:toxic anion resistance protein [Deferribacteraceae bacterium]
MDSEIVLSEKEATPKQEEEIARIKGEINLYDTNSIVSYGANAQRKTSEFMDQILSAIKNEDLSGTGEILTNLMGELQSFDADTAPKGFLSKLFSSANSRIAKVKASYTEVDRNISQVTETLEQHRRQLMTSNSMLDKLYEKSLESIEELKLYITAGEQKMLDVQQDMLPALKEKLGEANDPLLVQQVRDVSDAADRFDKKIHDLKLTRTVYIQSLPQIRMQQANNSILIDKIHSSIVNAIPLWKAQMVLSLGLSHTSNALKAQQSVTNATNELLRRNSEMLRENTVEIARENERSIVDIETVRKANEDIINTIKEVVQIQAEGRSKRQSAEVELKKLETELKENILKSISNESA